MVMKEYFTFGKTQEMDPHHQMYSLIIVDFRNKCDLSVING